MVALELKGVHKGDDHDHLHLRCGGGRGCVGGTRCERSDPITVRACADRLATFHYLSVLRTIKWAPHHSLIHSLPAYPRSLLVASKHWRELRKHFEEDAPKVLAEDLLTKGRDHDATRDFVRSTVQLSPQS